MPAMPTTPTILDRDEVVATAGSTAGARRRRSARLPLAAVALAAVATLAPAAPALAKGGTGGGGGTGGTTSCLSIEVTNNAQIVRNGTAPAIKVLTQSCTGAPAAATLTVTETASFFSGPCPSPVAAPVAVTLAPGSKRSTELPTYRGPCGIVSQSNLTIVPSSFAYQGHNLRVTLTDDATGAVLGSAPFSWSDSPPRGV